MNTQEITKPKFNLCHSGNWYGNWFYLFIAGCFIPPLMFYMLYKTYRINSNLTKSPKTRNISWKDFNLCLDKRWYGNVFYFILALALVPPLAIFMMYKTIKYNLERM